MISGASLFANNRSFICGALLFLPSSRKFERGRFMNKTYKAILNQIRQQFNGSKCSCNRRKIGHVDYKVWVIFQWYYKSENYVYSYVSSLILLIFKPFSNSFTYMFNVWLALHVKNIHCWKTRPYGNFLFDVSSREKMMETSMKDE